uniref:Uncharacterized protein n=1 Tax=Setaria viridis TaxID=4556 RepID=A0A4U6T1C7_SETVI|nr:hypothetical protein SEVIR_9G319300v2 [Setaria viridis]
MVYSVGVCLVRITCLHSSSFVASLHSSTQLN